MDILIPLLLMLLLYLVPELLRRGKTKNYKYPDVPPAPQQMPRSSKSGSVSLPPVIEAESVPANFVLPESLPVLEMTDVEEKGKNSVTMERAQEEFLTEKKILDGIVFAEILSPPRAYRPIARHQLKRVR